jgi:hypothetical protein
MYEAISAIIIAILTPLFESIRTHKNTATDAPPNPKRNAWANRVRKFQSRIRK